jgi:acyl-CoA thioesterase
MKPAKAGARRKARAGILNEQVLAERVVAGMMATDLFSQWLGVTVVDVRPRTATVRMTVRPEMVNGFGVAHGAIAFAVADSAFAFACNTHGRVTMSIENAITYPMAVAPGDVLTAVAECESETNRLGYYRVEVRNQKDEVVSVFRGTAYRTRNEHGALKGTANHAEHADKATK